MTRAARAAAYADTGDWRHAAECVNHDPDVFNPTDAASSKEQTAAAIAICNTCPVTTECLNDAIRTSIRHGVRGGRAMTTDASRRIVRAGAGAGGTR